ncbi:ABC transporter substrate-binding protein [Bradyrhizobium sp. KB893862 SZCCT0404]|uniref:ABC transporter substrate-binding protein n=1 Tax=Bradyrhizobium sp. KB893862 SZCCT0404 TaxID=2807672 RepID=UPI001BACC24C|nr:ABC transporter substrate-binding protein [Bradyrhizobium sp. KB893862 SZCCT0404]MBR1177007.1 ABC transporter substrate-binding protein [Bradyrhizobium sp. KB893862 SZCCT0404]
MFLNGLLRSVIAVALWGALGLSCRADSTGVTPTSIKIGFVGSLTGPGAIWGSGNLSGATLAFEELNAAGGIYGRKIELVIVDDESSAPKGIAGFNKLTQADQVFAIFGPSISAVGVPMRGVMAASGVPVFIPSFSSPDMTEPLIKNVFRTGTLNDRMQGRAIANYLTQELKFERIAIMRQSDQYGATGAGAIADRLKELGKSAVAVETFNAADTDMTSQVLRLRSADPQAIVVYGYPAPSAIAMRQIRELGITAELLGSSATSNQNFPEMVGKLAVGIKFVFAGLDFPETKVGPIAKFRESFQKRFPDLARQGRPAIGDAAGYGGAINFIEGLRKAGKDVSRESFMAALETFHEFDSGITLPTTFSATRHEGNTMMKIAIIKPDLSRELLPGMIDAQ